MSYVKNHTPNSDLAHITLTPDERANIATKLASGISFEIILDDVRESLYQGKRYIVLTYNNCTFWVIEIQNFLKKRLKFMLFKKNSRKTLKQVIFNSSAFF